MRMVEQLALLEEFERSAESRRKKLVEAQDEEQRFDQHRRQEKRREDKERERSADSMPATPEQIVHFQERLNDYDTATVQALMKNRQALDLAEDHAAELRSKASTLPDGRKVFRSEDGQHVYDENGAPLGRDVVDPASISRGATSWEAWSRNQSELSSLSVEREGLFAFQTKVDHAREEAEKPGVTQHELTFLGDDLQRSMPVAVKRELNEPSRSNDFSDPATGAQADRRASPTSSSMAVLGSTPVLGQR